MNILIPVFLLLCSSNSLLRLSSAISPDGLSLLAFKSAVSGDPSAILADWDEEDEDPCRWPGVSCANVSGFSYLRVVALTITGKNLSGYIPSELGSLIFLRRLNLHGNRLSGPIPSQMSNALNLHSLFLYSNNLSGPVPASLCNLTQLQNLDLAENSLSGPIPGEFRQCKQLQRLRLSGNRLSGEIPPGIWLNLVNLLDLDLSMNNFSGPLPPDLGSLGSLSGTLNLSYNQFSGEIPGSIGNLSSAVKLDLRFNNLSGEIPMLGNLAIQKAISFSGNPRLCGIVILSPCKQIDVPASQNAQISINNEGKNKGLAKETIILVAAANAIALAMILLAILFAYTKIKNSSTGIARLGCSKQTKAICCRNYPGSDSEESDSATSLIPLEEGFACEIEDLLQASAYVLGKGRMGILYKVVLGNGIPVAVRRLSVGAENRRDFAAEVSTIAQVKHPNVVRLKAFFWSPSEKLLVSEFISQGSLASAFRRESTKTLILVLLLRQLTFLQWRRREASPLGEAGNSEGDSERAGVHPRFWTSEARPRRNKAQQYSIRRAAQSLYFRLRSRRNGQRRREFDVFGSGSDRRRTADPKLGRVRIRDGALGASDGKVPACGCGGDGAEEGGRRGVPEGDRRLAD